MECLDGNNLRKIFLARRDQLDAVVRRKKSRQILERLAGLPAVAAAVRVLAYVSFRSEVETLSLIDALLADGKILSVPVVQRIESKLLAVRLTDPANQLAPGCFGILEPTKEQAARARQDPAALEVVLVPGSVFDRNGGRLGYGGGFYDRFLSLEAPQALRIGLAYEAQLVERVPTEPHDQIMDVIVTEQQSYDCRRLCHAQNSSVQGRALSPAPARHWPS